MTSGALASLVALSMMLVWMGNGYASRGVPMKQTIKMALAWVAIFAVGLLLYSLIGGSGSETRAPASTSELAGSPSPNKSVLHNVYYQTRNNL